MAIPHIGALHALAAGIVRTGFDQALRGVAFESLVLLGHDSPLANALLAWKPLVGLASYSLYLIHEPFMEVTAAFARPWLPDTPRVIGLCLLAGVTSGVAFHFLVERPCLDRAVIARVVPALAARLRWTDNLAHRLSLRIGGGPGPRIEAPGAGAED